MAAPPIYLDHHSTTPVRAAVVEAMRPFLTDTFGNPASAHAFGRAARRALEDARERVAARLGAEPTEVIFTSGATEANNLAIFGLAGEPPGHLVTSLIEHPCVVEPVLLLAGRGFHVSHLPIKPDGAADVATIPADARVITLMLVNHETGTVQPAVPPGDYAWHADAAQAAGKRPVNFHALGAATLTISAHKFGGPKGIGALLLRRGVRLRPRTFGGHQQQGRRPGTEPVMLCVGLAAALDLACDEMAANDAHVSRLRSGLLEQLKTNAAPLVINGPAAAGRVSPYVLNVSFPGLRADAVLMALDLAGVACSTGSACSSGSLLPSPVLKAMDVPDDVLRSGLRFSFGPGTTVEEVEDAARRIANVVRRLWGIESR